MTTEGERNLETTQGAEEASCDKESDPQAPCHHAVSVVVNAANSSDQNGGNTKDEKKHPLEYLAVSFALIAAIGGCVAAGFTWYQGWVSRDTETRYLRAYAMVESSVIGIDPNGKPNVVVTIKNFGLTPVYNFRHWACALVREIPDRDDDFPSVSMITAAHAPESLIAPNATILKTYKGSCFSNEEPISDPVRADVKSGRRAVFAIGVMKYRDAFGFDRETRYRRAWNDIQAIDGYSGNCADDNCPKDK